MVLALALSAMTSPPIQEPPRAAIPAGNSNVTEEFLGELSRETEPPSEFVSIAGTRFAARAKRGNKWVLIVDGKEGSPVDDIPAAPTITPEGRHVIWIAKRAHGYVPLIDGEELGPSFEDLDGIAIVLGSHDALANHAYAGRRGGNWHMIVDAVEGPGFSAMHRPVMSPDGKRVAYAAMKANTRWSMVVDGQSGPEFEALSLPVFSPDGRQVAYMAKRDNKHHLLMLNGIEGPVYEEMICFFFSSDGKHLAYSARRGKKAYVVFDGKEGPGFDDVGRPSFTPDGKHLVYRALRAKRWTLLVDAKEQGPFDDVGPFAFSPDGGLAYWAQHDNAWRVVADGSSGTAVQEYISGPAFSPRGRHMAYVGYRDGYFVVVQDSQIVGQYEVPKSSRRLYTRAEPGNNLAVGTSKSLRVDFVESLTFSPNGQRLAYVLGSGGRQFAGGQTTHAKRRVVVDGRAGDEFDTFGITDLTFSPGSEHVAYVVKGGAGDNGEKQMVVADGLKGKLYDTVMGLAIVESLAPRSAVIYFARDGRKFYRVTHWL
jgi:hypothetical protein